MRHVKRLARLATEKTGLWPRAAAWWVVHRKPVMLDGMTLPPESIRLGGHNFEDDRAFLDSGRTEARRLQTALGAGPATRILDIGCGVGRLPIGLLSHFGSVHHYTGVDIALWSIAWCQRFVARPGIRFLHLDLANERYNPRGAAIASDLKLPLPDASFDVIYLYSVFSHMREDDVQAYLCDFRRLLVPAGRVYLTAFVETGVENVTVNPPGYGRHPGKWEGALHCVRYNRRFFEGLVNRAGLTVERFDHGAETDGQSGIYLRVSQQLAGITA